MQSQMVYVCAYLDLYWFKMKGHAFQLIPLYENTVVNIRRSWTLHVLYYCINKSLKKPNYELCSMTHIWNTTMHK